MSEAHEGQPTGVVLETDALEIVIAKAICADDHLMCTYPDCGCKVIPTRMPAVMALVENAIKTARDDEAGKIEAWLRADADNPDGESFFMPEEIADSIKSRAYRTDSGRRLLSEGK